MNKYKYLGKDPPLYAWEILETAEHYRSTILETVEVLFNDCKHRYEGKVVEPCGKCASCKLAKLLQKSVGVK